MPRRASIAAALAGAISIGIGATLVGTAHEAVHSMSDEMDHDMSHQSAATGISKSTVRYRVPALTLVRQDGRPVSLPAEMDDGRPVLLNFIYTTCTSICPLLSQTFEGFQRKLGRDAARVHLMSISIDPEQDTPARLVDYARKFHAGAEWQHYTGTLEASIAAQRAFDVYRGDKMSHLPVTLLRASPGKPWVRIEGFVTPDDLVREYDALIGAR